MMDGRLVRSDVDKAVAHLLKKMYISGWGNASTDTYGWRAHYMFAKWNNLAMNRGVWKWVMKIRSDTLESWTHITTIRRRANANIQRAVHWWCRKRRQLMMRRWLLQDARQREKYQREMKGVKRLRVSRLRRGMSYLVLFKAAMEKIEEGLENKAIRAYDRLLTRRMKSAHGFWAMIREFKIREAKATAWMSRRLTAISFWNWRLRFEKIDEEAKQHRGQVLRRLVMQKIYGGNAPLYFLIWKKMVGSAGGGTGNNLLFGKMMKKVESTADTIVADTVATLALDEKLQAVP